MLLSLVEKIMNIYVPSYYQKFRCIADRCRHSCCVGWEIDIDKDTCEYYSSIDGDFGKKLADNISEGCGCEICQCVNGSVDAICIHFRVNNAVVYNGVDLHGDVIGCDNRLRWCVKDLLFHGYFIDDFVNKGDFHVQAGTPLGLIFTKSFDYQLIGLGYNSNVSNNESESCHAKDNKKWHIVFLLYNYGIKIKTELFMNAVAADEFTDIGRHLKHLIIA